jgi:hypothetical protein
MRLLLRPACPGLQFVAEKLWLSMAERIGHKREYARYAAEIPVNLIAG